MNEPVFWSVLLGIFVAGASVRLLVRRPLWLGRSTALHPWELGIAAASLVVLVFHCAAMFFAEAVSVVTFLNAPAASVRALGTLSQAAYWAPVALLVIAIRRLWLPALGILALTLLGVGITMFWPFELTTHLTWIGAAVISIMAIAFGLVARSYQPRADPRRTVTRADG